jgi:hypothetical protein
MSGDVVGVPVFCKKLSPPPSRRNVGSHIQDNIVKTSNTTIDIFILNYEDTV